MKQSQFTNQTVYWLLITLIGGLMIWNLYNTIISGRPIGLLPITIQVVLLGLMITKNQYAKIGIKVWAIIFLVLASGMQFVGRLLQDVGDSFANADALHYVTTGLTVLVGILIIFFVNKTVQVTEVEK